jgi:hypothetical protein
MESCHAQYRAVSRSPLFNARNPCAIGISANGKLLELSEPKKPPFGGFLNFLPRQSGGGCSEFYLFMLLVK